MQPWVASIVVILGIIGLFILDRDPEARTSKALWIPLAWLWLAASRSVTEWYVIATTGTPPTINAVDAYADAYMDGTPLDRSVLLALIVLGLLVLIRREKFVALLRSNVPVVLFFVYAGISVLWSDYPEVTIRRWFKGFGDLVMVMVVLTDPDPYAAIRRLFVWTGFLLIPPSVLVIKYYPAIGRTYNRWTWMVMFTGVTTHKNLLGGVCQIFGTAFVSRFLAAYRNPRDQHRARHLIAHGAALAIVAWLFVMANSVTAQSSFLLATTFLLASGRRAMAENSRSPHLLVATLVLVPFATLFLGIGESIIAGMGRDSTLTGRTEIWYRVIALAGNPLMGTGYESFWLGERLQKLRQYQASLNEAHNGYVEIFVTLGWIGVVLLIAIIVTGYRNIIISGRQNRDIATLKMAYFISVVVSASTEAAFRMQGISWIALLVITMTIPDDARRSSATVSARAS